MNGDTRGVWLYAVTDRPAAALPDGMRGVDGETVRCLEAAGLTAIVGTVGLSRFGETALKSNLEDLDWLAATARTHDTIVNSAVRHATTIPVRLATVYLDDTRVEKLLIDDQESLRRTLKRLGGRTEWGVKGYAATAAAATPPAEPDPGQGAGAAYLRRRRDQLSARQDTEKRAYQLAAAVHEALAAIAAEHRVHPPQDPRLTGATDTMVLNGAYLVDDERYDSFADAVASLSGRAGGVRLELTGPWPPYSFTGIDGSGS